MNRQDMHDQIRDLGAEQAFWNYFAGQYPPSNWDKAFEALGAAIPPNAAEIIGTYGVDLGVYFRGDTYPSGLREDKLWAIWASGDGFLGDAGKFLPRSYPAWEEEPWAGAVWDFCEDIASGLYADLSHDPEVEAFAAEVAAYQAEDEESDA